MRRVILLVSMAFIFNLVFLANSLAKENEPLTQNQKDVFDAVKDNYLNRNKTVKDAQSSGFDNKKSNLEKVQDSSTSSGNNKMKIEEILLYTYDNNESILSERFNLEAVKAAKLEAVGTGFLPDIYLSYENTDAKKSYDYNNTTTDLDSESYSVVLSQPLFRSGRSIIEIKDANMQIRAQKSYLRQVEQSVMYEAIQSYVFIIRDSRVLDLSLQNKDALEKSYEYAKERNKVGAATKAEVAIAEARYHDSRTEVTTAKSNLESSKANFERITGIVTNDIYMDVQRSDYNFEFDYDVPNILDSIISQSIVNNPTLQLAKIKYEIEKNNLRLKKAEFLPTVTLDASATQGEDKPLTTNQDEEYDSESIGITVKVPLFQSGVEYSDVKSANKKVSKAKYDFNYAKRKVVEESTKSYDDFLASKDIIVSRNKYVDAIKVTLDAVKTEERLGLKTIIDVLDIRREYFLAEIAKIKADADNVLAYFKVKLVLGDLNPNGLNLINNDNNSGTRE